METVKILAEVFLQLYKGDIFDADQVRKYLCDGIEYCRSEEKQVHDFDQLKSTHSVRW
ncbi:hypothetical protein HNR39_000840 [Glaciimonas immobilis]|uniref:Uncharacterized protein n=1 Tax=Glaciimonas immobilis TaxID=728004 RepID=A0A840RR08_9BURK|nr:hypothetical protein [Glaciimonas immobilis]